MEFPLVSIIVPMYNTAGCIARCVKSICAQTYKSIEILLLNDGSTDDTLAVCRPLAASDHRIALVDKTNTGAADTRNQALRWPTANTSSLWTATTGWPPILRKSWSPPPRPTPPIL